MKNTPENKAKFFALYYGQMVAYAKNSAGDYQLYRVLSNTTIDEVEHLSLRSIESLTDEQLTYLATWYGYDEIIGNVKDMIEFKKELEAIVNESLEAKPYLFDYLRSIGILIPWMDLSVKEILDYGWAVADNHPINI